MAYPPGRRDLWYVSFRTVIRLALWFGFDAPFYICFDCRKRLIEAVARKMEEK